MAANPEIWTDVTTEVAEVDFGSAAEADFNAACDLALNTAIPASNTSNSVNDVLLDQLAPRLPGSGTITTGTMRGTDNAALASVVGALNDAATTGVITDTDTGMAYIKQLVTAALVTPTDLGEIAQRWDAKPRPDPYNTGSVYTVVSDADTVNKFGTAVKIIPKTTYNFGDSPNQIQISGISVESMDTNAVYVLELRRDTTPIGALRFTRTSVQTRSFLYPFRGREVNADTEDVYAALKSTPANATVTFSVLVLRNLSLSGHIESSTGTFPTG